MAATVSLLLQKGIVNPVTKEELEKERLQIEKEKWLNEQKINDIIKERRKQKDHNRKDRHRSSRDRDRDYDRDDLYRERERAREAEKKFKNYKPVVNIEYHDEFGRTLTQKEVCYLIYIIKININICWHFLYIIYNFFFFFFFFVFFLGFSWIITQVPW